MNTLPFTVTIHGRGGHGSRPDQSHNPIDCFIGLNTALSQLRPADPMQPCIVTVTKVDGGNTTNVIPDTLRLRGVLRYTNAQDALHFRKQLPRLAALLCEQRHCTAETEV